MTTQNIIDRTVIIDGAANDDFHVNGLSHCDHAQPVQAVLTLDSAGVRGLTTAVHLVTPAAGKKIEPLGIYYSKDVGAYGAGASIAVRFTSGHVLGSILRADINSASAEANWTVRPNQSGLPDSQAAPEEGIEVHSGTAFSGNGGDLIITLIYLEVE